MVVAVDVAAAAGLLLAARSVAVQTADAAIFVVLVVAAALSIEIYRRVGSMHRGANRPFHAMVAVFYLAGALLLPALLAMLVVLPVQLALQVRAVRLPLVKRTFNAGLMMLACLAAAAVRDALAPGGSTAIIHVSSVTHGTGPLSVVAAGVVLVAVSETLLMGLLRQVAPATPWRAHFGDMEDWILNAVDLAAGAVLAVAWVVSPVFFGLATLLVLLLQRSAVHRHLVEMSQSDAKTGVANPVHWRTVTTRAVTRAQHVGGSMGVLMVDLDHFKAINDTCGHLAGDAVLTAVADTLRLAVRPGDLVGRFGGEEFAVLLDGAGIGDASSTAARIQQRIGMLGARSGPTGDPIYVTASIGLAVLGVHGDDLNELLAAADQALYQAKAAGRDRVELAIPTEKHPHPVPVF